jgi:hypothetical protein
MRDPAATVFRRETFERFFLELPRATSSTNGATNPLPK